MAIEKILDEVIKLHDVSIRLERLAGQHFTVSDALTRIAENVRNAATLLSVLIAIKLSNSDESTFANMGTTSPGVLVLTSAMDDPQLPNWEN